MSLTIKWIQSMGLKHPDVASAKRSVMRTAPSVTHASGIAMYGMIHRKLAPPPT